MDFLTFLYALSTLLAGAIGTLKSDEMMRPNRLVEAIAWKKHITNRHYKKLLKPTYFGWTFIVCIILSVFLSIVKEVKEDKEDKEWKKKVQDMNNENHISDSIYTNKLESFNNTIIRSDTLHTQMFIEYNKQLNKWGLEIRDSMIVRKEQYPLLRVYSKDIVFKKMSDSTLVEVKIVNKGDAIADSVKCQAFFGCKIDGEVYWVHLNEPIKVRMAVDDFLEFSSVILAPKYALLDNNECYVRVEGKFCKYKSNDCETFCYSLKKNKKSDIWGVIECSTISINTKPLNTGLFWNWLRKQPKRR